MCSAEPDPDVRGQVQIYLGVIQRQVSIARCLFGRELLETSKTVGKSDGSRRQKRKAAEEGGWHRDSQDSDMVGSSGRQRAYTCTSEPSYPE